MFLPKRKVFFRIIFLKPEGIQCIYIYNLYTHAHCIYTYGYIVFHRTHTVFSSILYVHVSETLCCARFPAVVHVSRKLRTCHSFTRPLITFVFNCMHTERILISNSIGATKHVLPTHTHTHARA